MPSRVLKEDLLSSERLQSLRAEEERLFTRLIVAVDDFGRMDARPAIVKARCFPLWEALSTREVAEWLGGLQRAKCLTFYRGPDGSLFLQLYGTATPRAQKSKCPAPDDASTCGHLTADEILAGRLQASANICAQPYTDASKREQTPTSVPYSYSSSYSESKSGEVIPPRAGASLTVVPGEPEIPAQPTGTTSGRSVTRDIKPTPPVPITPPAGDPHAAGVQEVHEANREANPELKLGTWAKQDQAAAIQNRLGWLTRMDGLDLPVAVQRCVEAIRGARKRWEAERDKSFAAHLRDIRKVMGDHFDTSVAAYHDKPATDPPRRGARTGTDPLSLMTYPRGEFEPPPPPEAP